jgi:hypothetical protein
MVSEFWLKPNEWPRDTAENTFLARAFDRVGKAKFGNEWTGGEATASLPDIIPDALSPKSFTDYASYATNLLAHHSTEFAARRLEAARRKPPGAPELTRDDWVLAKKLARQEHEAALPATQRRDAVSTAIVSACESGILQSLYRPVPGGAVQPIPREWWNTEQTGQRFHHCQINPSNPFAAGFAGAGYCWIFLLTESLDQFLVQQPHSDIQSKFDIHLSPYLRAMLSVAEKMKITLTYQPKKEEIKTELLDAWNLPETPLSENMLEVMASALREPISQLGRAGKPPNTKKKST